MFKWLCCVDRSTVLCIGKESDYTEEEKLLN